MVYLKISEYCTSAINNVHAMLNKSDFPFSYKCSKHNYNFLKLHNYISCANESHSYLSDLHNVVTQSISDGKIAL